MKKKPKPKKEPMVTLVKCNTCGQFFHFLLFKADAVKWGQGMDAAKAFPYLDSNSRSLMQTKTCLPCYNRSLILLEMSANEKK